jgi:hypothetical protein
MIYTRAIDLNSCTAVRHSLSCRDPVVGSKLIPECSNLV